MDSQTSYVCIPIHDRIWTTRVSDISRAQKESPRLILILKSMRLEDRSQFIQAIDLGGAEIADLELLVGFQVAEAIGDGIAREATWGKGEKRWFFNDALAL